MGFEVAVGSAATKSKSTTSNGLCNVKSNLLTANCKLPSRYVHYFVQSCKHKTSKTTTSFQRQKWLQTKMYIISDTVFWHSIPCPFTWCDPFCSEC